MICILTSRCSRRISEHVLRACVRVATNMFPSKPSCFSESISSLNSAHQPSTPSYKKYRFRHVLQLKWENRSNLSELLVFRVQDIWSGLERKVEHFILFNNTRLRNEWFGGGRAGLKNAK